MSDDPGEPNPTGLLRTFMADGGLLSAIIGTHGGRAISRLIDSSLQVPEALFGAIANNIRSGSEARSAARRRFDELIAEEAAQAALADPALFRRATKRLFGQAMERQQNAEQVAMRAAEELAQAPADEDRPISEDFLNRFEAFAESASSQHMQELFGRVLAGEIRQPGSFSLQALQVLSIMDQPVAEAFVRSSARILDGDMIFSPPGLVKGREFDDYRALHSAGLCVGEGMHKTQTIRDGFTIMSLGPDASYGVALFCESPTLKVHGTALSEAGRQIKQLIQPAPTFEELKAQAARLYDIRAVRSVQIGRFSRSGDISRLDDAELVVAAPA